MHKRIKMKTYEELESYLDKELEFTRMYGSYQRRKKMPNCSVKTAILMKNSSKQPV